MKLDLMHLRIKAIATEGLGESFWNTFYGGTLLNGHQKRRSLYGHVNRDSTDEGKRVVKRRELDPK